jgi:hypothetical protein
MPYLPMRTSGDVRTSAALDPLRAGASPSRSEGHPAPQSGCRNGLGGRREQAVPPTGSQSGVPLEGRGVARTASGAPRWKPLTANRSADRASSPKPNNKHGA